MIPLLVVAHTKQSFKQFLEQRYKGEKIMTITLEPQTSEYSINQIREIQKEVKISQPIKRVYIMAEAERISLEAQNAFLKLLEEPPDDIEFILVVSNQFALLPTLVSRTKIIRLEKEKNSKMETEVSRNLAQFVSKKSLSSLDFTAFTISTKEDVLEMIMEMISFFRNRLERDPLAPKIIKEILKVNQLLKHNNLNPQLALDHLLMFMYKWYNRYNDNKD